MVSSPWRLLREAEIKAASDALRYLAALVESEPEIDRLLDGYVEARSVLTNAFSAVACGTITSPDGTMTAAKARIEEVMALRFAAVCPADLLKVRGYGATHALLLAYLIARSGRPVSAARLRLLVGDQVHTERRIRELRDLGFSLSAEVISGENRYTLESTEQDLEDAAKIQIRANVESSKAIGSAQKAAILAALGTD